MEGSQQFSIRRKLHPGIQKWDSLSRIHSCGAVVPTGIHNLNVSPLSISRWRLLRIRRPTNSFIHWGICSSERTSHKKGLPLANVKAYSCIQSDISRKYRTRHVWWWCHMASKGKNDLLDASFKLPSWQSRSGVSQLIWHGTESRLPGHFPCCFQLMESQQGLKGIKQTRLGKYEALRPCVQETGPKQDTGVKLS